MKTIVSLIIIGLVLSQAQSQGFRSRLNDLFGAASASETITTPPGQSTVTTPPSPSSESTPSSSSESTPDPQTITTPTGESTVTTPEPAAPAPAPAALRCQAYQVLVGEQCVCNEALCIESFPSHSCTEESAAGECICNNQACAITNQVCSQNTIDGTCVECNENSIDVCQNRQTCYRNTCVCIDSHCEDGQVCEREFSSSAVCVDCRDDEHCQDFQICNNDGGCECRDELCGSPDLICTSEDTDGACQCFDENCPDFTICSEETINGTCSVAVECKADEDCAPGQLCDLETNTCMCDIETCQDLSTDDFEFTCGPLGRHCFALCSPPALAISLNEELPESEPYSYSQGLCPEDYSCVPIIIPIDILVQLAARVIISAFITAPTLDPVAIFADPLGWLASLDLTIFLPGSVSTVGQYIDFIISIDGQFDLENLNADFMLDLDDDAQEDLLFLEGLLNQFINGNAIIPVPLPIGLGVCTFNEIRCRTEAGLLIADNALCPFASACPPLGTGEIALSPFCSPPCTTYTNSCQGFQCPEGYSNDQFGDFGICVEGEKPAFDLAGLASYPVCLCLEAEVDA